MISFIFAFAAANLNLEKTTIQTITYALIFQINAIGSNFRSFLAAIGSNLKHYTNTYKKGKLTPLQYWLLAKLLTKPYACVILFYWKDT